jgi:hypothetical protein
MPVAHAVSASCVTQPPAVALVTGSLWGRLGGHVGVGPRLTSELLLLILYLGYAWIHSAVGT